MDSPLPGAGVPASILVACWLAPRAGWGQTVAPADDGALECPALDPRGPAADPDLYCIELIHAPDFPGASGYVELTPADSPFGAAVTIDGHHRFHLALQLAGLPDPAGLGDYSGYVAWATTPRLRPVLNLGRVANGRTAVGPIDLDKFLVLVTAESDPDAPAWEGRIVLRGTSAGMRMEPEDLLALTGMVGGAALPPPARGWRRPPMHPSVAMMPGVGRLTPPADPFLPSAAEPLPPARPREIVRLGDGGTLDLEAGLVERTIDGRTFTMYGFNGQYPGPLIHVPQDATITVNVTNRLSLPTAVHWHGIRLENRFDGVPGLTQDPIEPGETFQYRIHFPDAGLYWYHPHHREDVQQDLGLYGNLQVEAADPAYFGPANREQVLMLDDLLVDAA
ncbi:MAG: multicopper oxidase domain-containing protein, partial [Acidobacteria bacterium]|nr:multicopper oxidase domain-containing protein [Acidobacteriota bacterium]